MDFEKKCYRKTPSVISKVVDSETIILPLLDNVANLDYFYSLNSVASRIWELINGKRPMKDIKKIIIKDFEVEQKKVEGDLVSFLEQLKEKGWIEEVSHEEKKRKE